MAALFRLDRTLIGVSGPDAVNFLHNLLTQSVEGLDAPRYGALLSPQGKVIADMLLWPDAEGVVIETSVERGTELLRRLTMYKLRAQVKVDDIGDERGVIWSGAAFEGACPDSRFPDGALGYRKLTTRDQARALPDGALSLEVKRIALGVPDLARDAQSEEVFAGEALLEELHGVDFQKGCFIGQENVSRMKRRATTRRKFCPIGFEGPAPSYGAAIKAGDPEIGAVRTGLEGRAIALVRLDRAAEPSRNGVPLTVEGREIHLDPPPWLILPSREEA